MRFQRREEKGGMQLYASLRLHRMLAMVGSGLHCYNVADKEYLIHYSSATMPNCMIRINIGKGVMDPRSLPMHAHLNIKTYKGSQVMEAYEHDTAIQIAPRVQHH